jgi:hypothetical protein
MSYNMYCDFFRHSDGLLPRFSFQRQPQPPQRLDEEDSADELEHISTRALALSRYRRNHELMNEVFTHAAFGQSSCAQYIRDQSSHPPPSPIHALHSVGDKHPPRRPAPYSIFDKAELEKRAVSTILRFILVRKH